LSFLNPIAGLIAGSIGSALVVLFWMLKLRRRPVRVSSTLLWKKSIRDLEGNVPWQRVRPSVLLFLQLLAVILLSLAIARPTQEAGIDQLGGGEVVVVIDAGASMNAIADVDGKTRLEIAQRDAAELVRSIGSRSPSTEFRVIRAGTTAQLVSGSAGSWRRARAAIESIQASDAPSDLDAAVELIASIRDGEQTSERAPEIERSVQVFAFTDGEVSDGSVLVQRPSTDFDARDLRGNLGIVLTGAQRDQTDAVGCRVFVTVAGAIPSTVGVRIEARVGGSVLTSKAIELVPDEQGIAESAATLAFRLDRAAVVEVNIARSDVLTSDNTVWVMMPDPSPVVTTVVAPDGIADPLLVDVLSAVTNGVVAVVGEGKSVASGTGLLVYDRVERDPRVQLPTIEIGIGRDGDGTLDRVLSWDRSHPVMQDVDLSGLRFASDVLDVGDGETALGSNRDGAVFVESAQQGVRHLAVAFALEDSNWGVQVSMPMYFANAVRYLLPGTSGSGTVYTTGLPIGERGVVIDRVGMTTIEDQEVGVSLLNRSVSIRAGETMRGDWRDAGVLGGGMHSGRVELWRWFLLAGLIVLMIEWCFDMLRRRVL
jgi:Aerotolerance regulator N-terminal/von Willebrand factor type A domain